MKKIILTALAVASCCVINAQSGTNSPYSQYGLGILSDEGVSFNRGMNGAGVAFSEHDRINTVNPASYASIDSLSFLFDVGMSLQRTFFKEGSNSVQANNADFEYAVGAFRLIPKVGMSFGIRPFTNVGYNYGNASYSELESFKPVNEDDKYYTTNTFTGSGGIHQVFVGMGWNPVSTLSVGFNMAYLWGNTTRTVVNSYSDASVNTLTKTYTNSVSSYKLDLGLQYSYPVTKHDIVTLGVVYGVGHDLNNYPELSIVSTNSSNSVADTTQLSSDHKLALPTTLSVGVGYRHDTRWRAGIDYSLEKWSDIYSARQVSDPTTGKYSYKSTRGDYMNRSKFTIAGEYCQNEFSRSFLSRIRYRAGISYATPYYKVNGADGPDEFSATIGFAIPIMNAYNSSATNFSNVNVSAQWVRTSMSNAIKENTFRINIGLTFNERWFAKWKFN